MLLDAPGTFFPVGIVLLQMDLRDLEEDGVVNPFGQRANSVGSHDVTSCVSQMPIASCRWAIPKAQVCVHHQGLI